MLTRIRFPGHRQYSGRATSSTLAVPGKRNKSTASDRGQKLLPPAVIAPYARKSLSEIVFRQIGQRAVSDQTSGVNSVLQRRTVATQCDSRARPAKRQHRRCIGCEKTLLSLQLASRCQSYPMTGLANLRFRQKHSRFELRTSGGDIRKSVVSLARPVQKHCVRTGRISSAELHWACDRYSPPPTHRVTRQASSLAS